MLDEKRMRPNLPLSGEQSGGQRGEAAGLRSHSKAAAAEASVPPRLLCLVSEALTPAFLAPSEALRPPPLLCPLALPAPLYPATLAGLPDRWSLRRPPMCPLRPGHLTGPITSHEDQAREESCFAHSHSHPHPWPSGHTAAACSSPGEAERAGERQSLGDVCVWSAHMPAHTRRGRKTMRQMRRETERQRQ